MNWYKEHDCYSEAVSNFCLQYSFSRICSYCVAKASPNSCFQVNFSIQSLKCNTIRQEKLQGSSGSSASLHSYGHDYPSQVANINTDRHAVGTAGPLPSFCFIVSCSSDFQVTQQLLHSTYTRAAISEYLFQAVILNSIIFFLIPDYGFGKIKLPDDWLEDISPWFPGRNSREMVFLKYFFVYFLEYLFWFYFTHAASQKITKELN